VQASDELQWLATCYVLSELSPEDQQRFEERLATDEWAQRAVVEATRLFILCSAAGGASSIIPRSMQGSVAAERSSRVGSLSPKSSRLIPVSLAASMLLTAGLIGTIHQILPVDTPATTRSVSSRTSDLVRLWRDSPLETDPSTTASFSGSSLENEEADDPADDLAIPSWMMAAVSEDRESLGHDQQEIWVE